MSMVLATFIGVGNTERISFGGFPARSRVSDSISNDSLQVANQSPVMSPPRRSCIFPGCHSVQGNGSVSLFKFPTDDNVRKRWVEFVKSSYCGEFKITTNTRLCSVHFTPDSYSNYHQVKSGFLKSPLTLVSGAEPTLSVPGLHPPVPPTAGATITATGITCPPESKPTSETQHASQSRPIQNFRVCPEEKLLCLNMSKLQTLRAFVNQRLTAAAEEIFEQFERTIAEYEEELCRQRKLPDGVFKPENQLHRADVQQLLVSTEVEPPVKQEWSPSLDQKDPAEQPDIQDEHELPTSQEEEQLRGLEETDVPLISVKSEEANEESYQRPTEEIQRKADAEDCGASEPARNSDPYGHLQSDTDDESSDFSGHGTDDSSDWEETRKAETTKLTPGPGTSEQDHDEKPRSSRLGQRKDEEKRHTEHLKASHSDSETDDSCDWEESGSPPPGLNPKQVPVSDVECNSGKTSGSSSEVQPGKKSFSCSVCGKQYQWKTSLMVHMRLHSEGKRFNCAVCDKSFQFSVQIVKHMRTHTLEEVFNCSACGFVQTTTSASASRSKRLACPICKVPVTEKICLDE